MTDYVVDTFTDTNGTGLNSHTPDTDIVSGGWSSMRGTSSATAGGGDIQSNSLRLSNDDGGHVIDSGLPNCIIEVDWTPVTAQTNRHSIVARYNSDGNFWVFNVREDNGDWRLIEVVSEVFTTRDSSSFTWTEGNTYNLKVFLSGDLITSQIDGAGAASYQSSTYLTETSHGLYKNFCNSNAIFDNFKISSIDPSGGLSLLGVGR